MATIVNQTISVKVPVQRFSWNNPGDIGGKSYICGYCGKDVAPHKGFHTSDHSGAYIYICPNCTRPTFFEPNGNQTPKPSLGREVSGIDDANLDKLYQEARQATSVGAYTAAVLVCRKILMNIAVTFNAPSGLPFIAYVDYLAEKNFVPPNGKDWLDAIRQKGNEATHEIALMNRADAMRIIHFTEMLLRFNFEMKAMLKADEGETSQ